MVERLYDQGLVAAEAAAVIDAWPGDAAVPDAVAGWVRGVVRRAVPRTRREARNVLRWCGEYAQWRTRSQLALDDSAFGEAEVAKFVAVEYGLSPKGTRDAVTSHLRRLAPDRGFTPPSAPSAPGSVEPAAPVSVPSEVLAAMDGWVPARLAESRWLEVSDCVRSAVLAARPQRPGRATDLLRAASYLAGWVAYKGRPVRTDVVFSAATIEAFIGVVVDVWPLSSVRTVAANLHHLRDAVGLPLDVERRRFSRDEVRVPYTVDEVNGMYRQAAAIPTARRRRHVGCGLDLLFGAGLTGADAGRARPEHVIVIDGRVRVQYSPGDDLGVSRLGLLPEVRDVVVLPGFADRLVVHRDAAVAAGEEFLLGGSGDRRDRRFSNLLAVNDSQFSVEVDAYRARLTWSVRVARLLCAGGDFADVWRVFTNRDVIAALEADTGFG
jgi:hypothetical protein